MKKIFVINGPNINILGKRENEIYGNLLYSDLNNILKNYARDKGADLEIFQSNNEGEIINKIQELIGSDYAGLIINPAAYSHYSYAIYDALKALNIKKVEVHLTNILARDEFRKTSITAAACDGVITGFNFDSYKLAIEYLLREEL